MGPLNDEWLPTRRSLLERLKDWNDRESWEEFVSYYGKAIYGAAVKTGLNNEESQDVVQQVYIGVANKIGTFDYDPKRSFKAWLLGLTKWRIAEQFRQRQKHGRVQALDDPANAALWETLVDPDSATKISVACDDEWEKSVVRTALQRLTKRVSAQHVQIFDLYALRGWPPEEVAKAFGVTKAIVYRTKNRLQPMLAEEIEELEKRGLRRPAGPIAG